MSGKITRAAFQQLIAEDIVWLEKYPRTLEREHIIEIVRESERYYYDEAQDEAIKQCVEKALRPLEEHEKKRLAVWAEDAPTTFDVINRLLKARREANRP